MINKKNVLGKTPDELGAKDAIHVAIVAVRAGGPIKPGARVGMNKDREAVADSKGCGVADPFRKAVIGTGDVFWLLLAQDEVPNVQHVWQHESIDFAPPAVAARRNRAIQRVADDYGLTYEQVMEAASSVADTYRPIEYSGSKTAEELKSVSFDHWDFWSEWADETAYEFENEGSGCCPEYNYPRKLFTVPA